MFILQRPLLFRRKGDRDWSEGTTVMISKSAAKFRCKRALPLATEIDMAVTLPVVLPGEQPARLVSRGVVTRCERSGDGNVLMTASIRQTRIARGGEFSRAATA